MYGYLLDELRDRGVRTVQGIELSHEPALQARARESPYMKARWRSSRPRRRPTWRSMQSSRSTSSSTCATRPPFCGPRFGCLRPAEGWCWPFPTSGHEPAASSPQSWGWYQVPVHLFHFSQPALRALAQDAGFSVDQLSAHGGDSLFVLMTLRHALIAGPVTPGPLSSAARAVHPGSQRAPATLSVFRRRRAGAGRHEAALSLLQTPAPCPVALESTGDDLLRSGPGMPEPSADHPELSSSFPPSTRRLTSLAFPPR